MSGGQFSTTRRKLNELVDDEVEVSVIQSPRSTRGDVLMVAELEGIKTGDSERVRTEQTTVEFVNDAGEVYAEAIVHVLQRGDRVAMIDWVEVVDEECWGHGVGRALHEDVVRFIDGQLGAGRVYSKIENPRMQGPLLDTGFTQIGSPSTDVWYRRG